MHSCEKTYTYPTGEIQRVQAVYLDDWSKLNFMRLAYEPPALEGFAHIYQAYLIPECPVAFGQIALFRLPERLQTDLPMESEVYGTVADPLTAATQILRRGVKLIRGKPRFLDPLAKQLWQELDENGCIATVKGKLPHTTIVPVGPNGGFLSRSGGAKIKINASFFVMDPFDSATAFDYVGTPVGLRVKDGEILSPPLFEREALLVDRQGRVTVRAVSLSELTISIGGKPCRNVTVYSRPQRRATPKDSRRKIAVVGCRVVAVKNGGRMPIPASGFVLCCDGCEDGKAGDTVTYSGLDNVMFGIQVGNSLLRDGIKTNRFLSRFYNIRRFEPIPYPPSLYSPHFNTYRAARTAIGADADGRPMLVWAEGKGKLDYVPGQDSRGATLVDMANICEDLGMVTGINLDGGGSAQLLMDGRRWLQISDRNEDNSEAERAIPLALIVE